MVIGKAYSWLHVKEHVKNDKCLEFFWGIFCLRSRCARQVNRNILLKHKRSLVRLFCSQHRFEVEYLRYFKGEKSVTRENSICRYCFRAGRNSIGDEKHMVCCCPAFVEDRANLLSSCHETIKRWHLRGCVKTDAESTLDYCKRRRAVKTLGDQVRTGTLCYKKLNFGTLLSGTSLRLVCLWKVIKRSLVTLVASCTRWSRKIG